MKSSDAILSVVVTLSIFSVAGIALLGFVVADGSLPAIPNVPSISLEPGVGLNSESRMPKYLKAPQWERRQFFENRLDDMSLFIDCYGSWAKMDARACEHVSTKERTRTPLWFLITCVKRDEYYYQYPGEREK